MTEEEQAAAVEGALAGQVQCVECKQWLDPAVRWAFTCPTCWARIDRTARTQYLHAWIEYGP
jgi:predicted RNA-binding Zn-ribbon protein involved in translation (DUF1610 family)